MTEVTLDNIREITKAVESERSKLEKTHLQKEIEDEHDRIFGFINKCNCKILKAAQNGEYTSVCEAPLFEENETKMIKIYKDKGYEVKPLIGLRNRRRKDPHILVSWYFPL